MSSLFVYHVSSPQVPDKILTHLDDIASTLAGHGVQVGRLEARARVAPGEAAHDVLEALRAEVERLMVEPAKDGIEVISVDAGNDPAARDLPVEERVHAGAQTLWFIAGQGLLSLRIGDYVYAILCGRHDWVTVPAGVGHWLDMGEQPRLCALRTFTGALGQLATSTGDEIAARFVRLDDLV